MLVHCVFEFDAVDGDQSVCSRGGGEGGQKTKVCEVPDIVCVPLSSWCSALPDSQWRSSVLLLSHLLQELPGSSPLSPPDSQHPAGQGDLPHVKVKERKAFLDLLA